MGHDDDWEPLPPEQLAVRPGEGADIAPRTMPVAAAKDTDAAGRPVPAPAVAPDPAAERLLVALKQRLAAAAPPRSFVAAVQHRQHRAERRQRAPVVAPELASTVQQGSLPAPQVEYDPVAGRDAREESEWYRGLPPAEQQRLAAAWARQREHQADGLDCQRRRRNRRTTLAMVCFLVLVFAGTGAFWPATMGAGVLCGLWWRHGAADRFLDPVRALVCFGGMQGLAMAVQQANHPSLFLDAVLLIAFAAVVGFDGEIRRSGGFDVR